MLPETRVKTVTGDGMKVVRFVQPELDAFNHVCKSHYHLIVTKETPWWMRSRRLTRCATSSLRR